jgi:hypothetical protein
VALDRRFSWHVELTAGEEWISAPQPATQATPAVSHDALQMPGTEPMNSMHPALQAALSIGNQR